MARHELQFFGSFDSSEIERQTKKLSQTIQNSFGKKGVPIVDKTSMDFLHSASMDAIKTMRQELKAMKNEAKKYEQEIQKAANGSETQNKLVAKRLELVKKVATVEQQMQTMQKMQGRISASRSPFNRQDSDIIDVTPMAKKGGNLRTFGSRAASAVGSVAEALPGPNIAGAASGAMRAGSGMGAMAGTALTALAGAAAGAVIAIQRMTTAAATYTEQLPRILRLSAFGQGRAGGVARETAQQLGYTPQETFALQEQLTKALGTTSQAGSEARVANVLTASRQLGMDPSQIGGMTNQLRAVGGTQAAGKQMADMLNRAVTRGMDASQASHFLEAATGMLTTLNETGIMSTDRMLAAMMDLQLDSGMSAEQAAKSLTTIQAAISGSQGEANAFFQMGAARGGVGGGSMLGAQEAVRQGLTGVNLDELTKLMDPEMAAQTRDAFKGLSGENYTQNFARGILEQLDAIAPNTGSPAATLNRGRVLADQFGANTAAEGVKIEAILKKVEEGQITKDQADEMITELTKDPEKAWRDNVRTSLDRIAIASASVAARAEFTKVDLGEKVQPIVNAITKLTESIDKALLGSKTVDELSKMDSPSLSFGGLVEGFFEDLIDGFGLLWGEIKQAFENLVSDFFQIIDNIKATFGFGEKNEDFSTFSGGIGQKVVDFFTPNTHQKVLDDVMAKRFEKASGGKELDDDNVTRLRSFQKTFARTGDIGPKMLESFNKEQEGIFGGQGETVTREEMINILKQIAQNTGKTANGKRRVELRGNPVDSTSPNLR